MLYHMNFFPIKGNKTHQLAERGKKVIACEADPKRFKLLSNRMKLLGASEIVEPKLQNFFEIDVTQESLRRL